MNDRAKAWFNGWPVTKGSYTSGHHAHRGNPPSVGGSSPGGGHGAIGILSGATPEERKEAVGAYREAREQAKKKVIEATIDGKDYKFVPIPKGKRSREVLQEVGIQRSPGLSILTTRIGGPFGDVEDADDFRSSFPKVANVLEKKKVDIGGLSAIVQVSKR